MQVKVMTDEEGNVFYRNEKGECHREDGPAVELYDGRKRYWLNGKQYHNIKSNKQWKQLAIKILLLGD
jgi:hypothetical protein